MSRSFRHTPISASTGGSSEKFDKQKANRKLRSAVKVAMEKGEEVLPVLREVSDIWVFNKDGKIWWPKFLHWPHKRR